MKEGATELEAATKTLSQRQLAEAAARELVEVCAPPDPHTPPGPLTAVHYSLTVQALGVQALGVLLNSPLAASEQRVDPGQGQHRLEKA